MTRQEETLAAAGFPNTPAGKAAFYNKYPTKEAWEQSQLMAYGGMPDFTQGTFGNGITMAFGGYTTSDETEYAGAPRRVSNFNSFRSARFNNDDYVNDPANAGKPHAEGFWGSGSGTSGGMSRGPLFPNGGTPYYGGPLYPAQDGVQMPIKWPTFKTASEHDKFVAKNPNLSMYSPQDLEGLGLVRPLAPNPNAIKKQNKYAYNPAGVTQEGAGLFNNTQGQLFTFSNGMYNPYSADAIASDLPPNKYGGLPGGPHQYEMPCMNCGGYMEDGGDASLFNYGAFPAMQGGGNFQDDGSYPQMNFGGIDYSSTINDVFSKYQKKSGGDVTKQGGNQDYLANMNKAFMEAIQGNVINKFNKDERDIANQVTREATQQPIQQVEQTNQRYAAMGGPGMSYGYNSYDAPNLDNQYRQQMYQAKINSYNDQHALDKENMFGANQMLAGYIDQTLGDRRAGAQEAMGMYQAQEGGDWDAAMAQQEAEEAQRTAIHKAEQEKALYNYTEGLRKQSSGEEAAKSQNPSWSQQAMQNFGPDSRLNGLNYFPGNVGRGYQFGKEDMAKLSKLTANDPLTGVQLNYGRLGRMAPRFFGPKSITFGTVNPNKGYFEDLSAPVSYDQPQQDGMVDYRGEEKRKAGIAKLGPEEYKRQQAYDNMSWSEKRASKKAAKALINQDSTENRDNRFDDTQREFFWNNTTAPENAYGGLYKAQKGYQNPMAFTPNVTEEDMNMMAPAMPVAPVDPNYNPFTDQAAIQKRRQEQRDLTGAPMGDAPDILAPDTITAKSKLQGVGQLFGQYAVPGINTVAGWFEQPDLDAAELKLEQGSLANNAKVVRSGNAFDMGTYNINTGDSKENEKNFSQFPGYNVGMYGGNFQQGGEQENVWEDDLTDEEIENLRAQGYNIEYLD